jgi:hypothetical protein
MRAEAGYLEVMRAFEVDDIRDWRGHDVVDQSGSKVGMLEAVYFDTASEEPTFASVRIGMPGRHRLVFVPLEGARVAPNHLRVMSAKKLIKDGPSIDADGELTAEIEPDVFAHFGIDYRTGASGERRLGRR